MYHFSRSARVGFAVGVVAAWLGGLLTLGGVGVSRGAIPAIKSGETIAFLGDSITYFGGAWPGGYVNLVVRGLAANGIDVKAVKAGVGGDTSVNMLARLKAQVLARKPDWMTLSCGVNDVWHGSRGGVLLPEYEKNIKSIVRQAQAAGIKVMIMTSSLIGENPQDPNNRKLVAYNQFLRRLAIQKHCLLADINAAEVALLRRDRHLGRWHGNLLTVDGVHPNPLGHVMFAQTILRAFGLNAAEIKKARQSWKSAPQSCLLWGFTINLSWPEYRQLAVAAERAHTSVDVLLNRAIQRAVHRRLPARTR